MIDNELTSVICDMEDIKTVVKRNGLWNYPKDNDGTETTVGDCVNDVLNYLLSMETQSNGK